MPGPSSRTIRTFQTADAEPLAALLRDSLAAGELAGYTSSELEGYIGAFPIVRNMLVAEIGHQPVGLISADYKLVVVRPDLRRLGIGRALVDALSATMAGTPDEPLILYPPHGMDGARAFLEAIGFRYDHSFWRFSLERGRSIPLPKLPAEFQFDSFRDSDILPYIDLINTAFLDHPTPLRVTQEQIEHVHSKPTFDPAAIVILRNERGQMIGFCTTGVDRAQDSPLGTINLVGVLKGYRGQGLGRWLLLWGIQRLRSIGVGKIELSVDAKNAKAVGLYRSVGFDPVEEWPQWIRAVTR